MLMEEIADNADSNICNHDGGVYDTQSENGYDNDGVDGEEDY